MANLTKTFGKLTIPLLVLLAISFWASPAQAKYGGGTGEPNDPYLIFDANQMNAIGADSNDWDKHFILMADIDLSAFTGTSFNIIGKYVGWHSPDNKPFTGVFDGSGHTISNFSYTTTGTDYIGLFGYVDDPNAHIKDLGLIAPDVDAGTGGVVSSLVGYVEHGTITNCYSEGGSVSGDHLVGGLVGYSHYGTIANCYSQGDVSGKDTVGGLVGSNWGTITNCYSQGSVTGEWFVGGLVGRNWGSITNCYSTGSVSGGNERVGGLVGDNHLYGAIANCYSTGSVSGNYRVGGLVGLNSRATITNCYSTGSVSGQGIVGGLVGFNSRYGISNCHSSGDVSGDWAVGGLVGSNTSTITNCYSTGSVSGGNERVGGLVGDNRYGTITNCYSTGSVTGEYYVGGLVGWNDDGTVTYSFWDIQTSGQSTSAGGTGKTTAEMQMASTFFVWACSGGSVWTIDEGNDYPRLWWENMPGKPITNPYGGGTGEPNDPYLVYTAEQLNTIGLVPCHLDKHFKLMADIDLAGFTGTSFNTIGVYLGYNDPGNNPFTGVFDGNGHTISNFTYISTGTHNIGLFGYVGGLIKDLGLIDPNVDAGTGREVGSLVGYLREGTITNCYVEGGSVFSGGYPVGGLVGWNSGTITNCYSTGSASGNQSVGGLVGRSDNGTITNCYSTGSVSGGRCVGGLVGEHNGTITNCYATGDVSGYYYVGGLVGINYRGGRVFASFWDIETSGRATSEGGTGKTTAEMQMMSTFTDAGWDFVGETFNGIEDIWFIPQQDYPHLWWEGMQVPMKLTPRTLNCRSYGNWVKAHLTLPEGFTVEDVDSNRPAVLHSFGFESAPLYVSVNENELVEIEAAFEREAVCSLAGDWPEALTVAGFLTDGNIFLGTSTVRMITPGLKEIGELSLYWLNADCVQPDFCDGIDMNRDSLVNLLDYALLLNCQVEFVSE